jgi:hypothetical protein
MHYVIVAAEIAVESEKRYATLRNAMRRDSNGDCTLLVGLS